MATDEPFDAGHPPDEGWWTRELHRHEKAFDQFMASLGEAPDSMRLEHFGLEADPIFLHESPTASVQGDEQATGPDAEFDGDTDDEIEDEDENDPDDDPEVNGNYPAIARLARHFAAGVFSLDDSPRDSELLCLSAGKIGANLAGGHGLGYDDEFICGNIVKCRWALSDCEFCREMLEQWHEHTGDPLYAQLAADSRRVAEAIRERIAALRQRVWW